MLSIFVFSAVRSTFAACRSSTSSCPESPTDRPTSPLDGCKRAKPFDRGVWWSRPRIAQPIGDDNLPAQTDTAYSTTRSVL